MPKNALQTFLLGFLTYLIALLFYLPAVHVAPRLLQEKVQLQGIEGSLWSGSARSLTAGDLELRQFSWDWHFLPLLTGRLGFGVATANDGAFDVAGTVAWNLWEQQWELQDVEGAVTAEFVLIQQLKPLQFEGRAKLHVQQLVWRHNEICNISAQVDWTDAAVGVGAPVRLGFVNVLFDPTANGSLATLQGSGGDVDLKGNIELDADLAYRVLLKMTPIVKLQKEVGTQLSLLGVSPTKGGEWRYSGRVPGSSPVAVQTDSGKSAD